MAKGIFLDAVSVLAGEEYSNAVAVWDAWHGEAYKHAVRVLTSRGLISTAVQNFPHTTEVEVLRVHDVVQSLGRAMLRDPSNQAYGSRVWVEGGELIGLQQVRWGWHREACKGSGSMHASMPWPRPTAYITATSD